MDSYSIQENVESLQLIPQQQPGVEEEQLDMQIMPIEDHVDASATLERLSNFKASQVNFEFCGLQIKSNNQVANLSPKKIDGYNPIINFIKKCCISEAFVRRPAAMYGLYLNEYWYTTKYNDETKVISFTTKNASFEIKFGVCTFRKVCGFEYLEKGLEYDNEPTFEEIQKTMLGVGYRKGNGPNQPLESTLLKTGFSPTWRLLMAYISNSLGGNIGSKDQLNYMHQLIAHGLINGVKLDYGGIIFNDLAAKLTNSVRHTSPAYARFISLILEKALGDSYVLSDEIGLKIPIMGNSIFNLDPSLLEVPISSHMVRVCQSEPDSAVVSEDVAGILLCDNVSDGSPSIDTNLNEIVQKVKTKSINSLLDPKLKESTGVYEYKVVSNCLNEEVVADTAVAIDYDSVQSYIYVLSSGDQSLKDDCPVNSNQVCNYHNNVASFQEEVVGDIVVGTGSGDQSLKYDCPVNSNQVCNYQNNVALFQEVVVGDTTVPTGSGENLKDGCPVNSNEVRNYQNNGGDQSLKDGCDVNSNKVCNYQNNGGDENLKDGCHVNSNEICNYQNNGGDENLKDGCHVNSNEVCNYHNDGGSFHEVQTKSNLFAIMVSKQVSPAQSFENLIHEGDDIMNVDCDDEFEIKNGIASSQKEIKDDVNELKKSLSSKSSTYDITKEVISAIEPELKNIKDHITKIETPSFPSKESLVVEFVKCIETTNSSVSKDVMHLISKQKELSDKVQQLRDSSLFKTSTEDISKAVFALIKPELKTFVQSVTDSFSKTKVNIHVPEDFTIVSERMKQHSDNILSILNTVSTITQRLVQLSPEFASLPVKIQELCSTMNDIVNFKVEISNLANKTQENVSTFKEFCEYFSNLQNSVNVFENLVEESIPTKKEREEDQQLLDVISLDQGIIKGKISKIAECMLLLVKWAKSICVDDSASIAKTIVAYEEAPLKQAEFDKDFTELPLDPESNVIPASTIQEPTSSVLSEDVCHERPQTETSSHVVVAEIHTTYAQKEGKQHIVAESSNKNDEICDNVTANPTSSDGSLSHKPDDIFRYEAGGVEHVMTSEEIAKQKEDEEIIKRKNEENKASYAEVLRVIEEEARSLQIQKNSAIRAEEDKQLQIKFKNQKLLYKAVNPQCRFLPQKITAVDILSRKGPISVMVFREGSLNFKVHNPLNLREFNYDEWMEIKKCMVTKTSKQAKIILDNIEYRVKELSEIKKSLGLVSGVPLSELDPMIEYHGLLNKRKLDDIEKEGSFVSGMDCDLSIPLELVNKDLADGQVLYEPEFGMQK
ncbi:hypothetical protein Tco_0150198 [Tanacetum coccineum]